MLGRWIYVLAFRDSGQKLKCPTLASLIVPKISTLPIWRNTFSNQIRTWTFVYGLVSLLSASTSNPSSENDGRSDILPRATENFRGAEGGAG